MNDLDDVYKYFDDKDNIYDNIIDCIEWLIKEGYFNKEYLVMKARHIKELRKKIFNYKEFTIVTSGRLFGEFYDYYAKDAIFADNPYHAIQRYLRWWQRKYKRKHKFYKNYYAETTHCWGVFEVIDEKGYKTYWM